MGNSERYRQALQRIQLNAAWFIYFLLLGVNAQAQSINPTFFDSEKKLSQFILRNWTTEDGLPSSTLLEVVQGEQGYIWISSYNGLIRFDGHTFQTMKKKNGKRIKGNHIVKLPNAQKNEIWTGTSYDGLFKIVGDSLHSLSDKLEGIELKTFLFDTLSNRLWLGTAKDGLYFMEDEIVRKIQFEGVSNVIITALHQDDIGTLWVATEGKGLSRYKNGRWEVMKLPYRYLLGISQGQKGKIWVSHSAGLYALKGDKMTEYDAFKGYGTSRVIENKNGDILVSGQKGLCRITNGTNYDWLTADNGLPDTEVTDITFDREGSLWLSTYRGGLVQLVEGKFRNYSQDDGLASKVISIIHELTPDTFLIGTTLGVIHKLENGQLSTLKLKNANKLNGRIYSILKDRKQRLWIGTYQGLLLVEANGRETWFDEQNGLPSNLIRVIFEDDEGNIWIGTKTNGLIRIDPDLHFTLVNTETHNLSDDFIMDITEDEQNRLLVATNNGGLNLLDKELNGISFSQAEGLADNLIFNAYVDQRNIIWLATKAGISRFDGKNFVNIGEAQGLPAMSVFDILEDDYGFLWMSSSKGIIKVSKGLLNEYAAGNQKVIHWHLYDRQDGMRNAECTGATSSLKAKNGTLWFPTIDGLSFIHPKSDKINTIPPFVNINGFLADGQNKELGKITLLKPTSKRFVFSFAGLSLLAPDKVHYRFKLEGFDEQLLFTDERKAVYTNLPYGEYTFKVWSSNNDGIWSEEPAFLDFTIETPYWAKWWFITLCISLIIALSTVAHKLRVRTIKAQKRELALKVEERTADLSKAKDVLEQNNAQILLQNKELEQQKEEIESQRDEIEAQNKNLIVQKDQIEYKNFEIQRNQETINRQNDQLKDMNLELEAKVQKRTTELQRAYQDLLKAHKQVDHFTYRSAHDLKGPIARLLGLCYLGKLEVKDEIGQKYVQMLESTAQQMGNLLNKLLRTHEIRTLKMRSEVVNLSLIAQAVWDRLHGFSTKMTFKLSPEDENIQHLTDPFLMDILFENLIQNALQYSDPNKTDSYLHVSLDQGADSTIITIKDNGMGIPIELGNKAFEMFIKGTEKSEGAGLGLYEAKVIVEDRIGGKIWLKEFGENEPTEIEIILPFVYG